MALNCTMPRCNSRSFSPLDDRLYYEACLVINSNATITGESPRKICSNPHIRTEMQKYLNAEVYDFCEVFQLGWINYEVIRSIWTPIIFLLNLGIVVRICKQKTNENKEILKLAIAFMINVVANIMHGLLLYRGVTTELLIYLSLGCPLPNGLVWYSLAVFILIE